MMWMKDKTKKTDSSTTTSQEAELEHFIVSSSCKTMEKTDGDNTEPILISSSSSPHNQHERISPSSSSSSAADDNDIPAKTSLSNHHKGEHLEEEQQQEQQRGGEVSFFMEFMTAKGPAQITILLILLAFSIGSTVGVIPAVMSDRFARLHYGYGGSNNDDEPPCFTYNNNDNNINDKPAACHAGYSHAQNALATEMFVAHGLTFFSSSLVGALSDEHGRRGIFILGIAMSALNPITLLLIQLQPNMSPWWYYGFSGPLQGILSWSIVALSSLTDAIPKSHHRAPSFGLAIAGLAIGFALGPCAVLFLGHVGVSILSLVMVCIALLYAIFCLPETLTPQAAARAKLMRQQQEQQQQHLSKDGILLNNNSNKQWLLWYLYRPMWELSILNRDHLFQLLALVAFLCGIVSSGDKSLILYYIQEQLKFTDRDIAHLFLVVGILGILSQACLLKLLNDAIGERRVVILGLSLGTIHNALYGLAETKRTIYIAASIATIVSLVHPTLSAILSNNVEECEYGRIHGALASLQSLAAAFGPMTLRFVYHFTKDGGGAFLGPGSMFIFASGLYAIAACCSYFLPPSKVNSNRQHQLHHPEEMEEGPDFVIAGAQLI